MVGDVALENLPASIGLAHPRGGMDHEDASVLAILTADDDERACTSQSRSPSWAHSTSWDCP